MSDGPREEREALTAGSGGTDNLPLLLDGLDLQCVSTRGLLSIESALEAQLPPHVLPTKMGYTSASPTIRRDDLAFRSVYSVV
jgi:hypothetical protein